MCLLSQSEMYVTVVDRTKISDVVDIHIAAFPNFFLTTLGKDFLTDYYSSFVDNSKGTLLGCFDGKSLVGFCCAAYKSRGFNSFLIKSHFLLFAKRFIILLIKDRHAILRLIKNFSKRGVNKNDSASYAELYSIAVSPNLQCSGCGKLLMFTLEKELINRKVSYLSLTTDVYCNENTLKFYFRLGFKIFYSFTSYPDRQMYRLIKKINV